MITYIIENWIAILISIVIGIMTGVISTIIYSSLKDFYDRFQIYGKSKFTGYWKTHIYDNDDNLIKIDYCELRHNRFNNEITGRIIREKPETQNKRKWKCNGILQNEKIIMSFWSDDGIKSDGSGYLFLVDDYLFEGLYMHSEKNNDISNVKVKSQKILDPTQEKILKEQFKITFRTKI